MAHADVRCGRQNLPAKHEPNVVLLHYETEINYIKALSTVAFEWMFGHLNQRVISAPSSTGRRQIYLIILVETGLSYTRKARIG